MPKVEFTLLPCKVAVDDGAKRSISSLGGAMGGVLLFTDWKEVNIQEYQ